MSFDAVARLNSSVKDSGEFTVMVVAVYPNRISMRPISSQPGQLTDNVNHESLPTFLLLASCRNRSYTDRIFGDAGRVFGRANGALMSTFRAGESFDIFN